MPFSILLRDVTESDLPILFEQQLDPEATVMAAFPSRDRESFMAHWAKSMANDSNILKTIVVDGQVAGNIVSWEIEGRRKVGYWLGWEFWGKGIATRALADFLEVVKARPLMAHVAKHNLGSRQVLEKCGFVFVREEKFTEVDGTEVEEFILKLESD